MSQETVNPYEIIGTQYAAGLAAVIGALPGSPTIDDLVTAVYNYIQPIYYPVATGATVPLQVQTEIKSVAYHAINSYINSLVPQGSAMFVTTQYPFIAMLIGSAVSKNLPINLTNWIGDVEDNITKSDMTVDEQRPILIATTIGEAAYAYWRTETLAGGGSAWASYFILNNNDYNSIPYWVEASMNGGLCGYGANYQGLVEPNTNRFSTSMISSLIGALTIAAGKVIFGWIPRITKKLSLNSQTVSALNNMGSGTLVFGNVGTGTNAPPCTGANSCLGTCLGAQCPTSVAMVGGIDNCNGTCVTCKTCPPNNTCVGTCQVSCIAANCQTQNVVGSCNGFICATIDAPTCKEYLTCHQYTCQQTMNNQTICLPTNQGTCQPTCPPSCNAANCSC